MLFGVIRDFLNSGNNIKFYNSGVNVYVIWYCNKIALK